MGDLNPFSYIGGAGQLLSLPLQWATTVYDIQEAQRAAQERREHMESAISEADKRAQDLSETGRKRADKQYETESTRVKDMASDMNSNISRWYKDFEERGGYAGQTQELNDQLLQQATSYLNSPEMQKVLADMSLTEKETRGDINRMRDLFTQDRAGINQRLQETAKSQEAALSGISGAKQELDRRTDETLQRGLKEASETINLEEIRTNNEKIYQDLMKQRGEFNIQSATGGILAQRDQALRDVEQAYREGKLTPQAYLAQKQAIQKQSYAQVSDAAGQISQQTTQQWLQTSVDLQNTLTSAKTNLSGMQAELRKGALQTWATESTALQTLDASTRVEFGKLAGDLSASLMQGTAAEAAYLNQARQLISESESTRAGFAASAGQTMVTVAQQAFSTMATAIQMDETTRKYALVDLPNQISQYSTENLNQLTDNYYSNRLAYDQLSNAFRSMGIEMDYNWDPAMVSLSGFVSNLQNTFKDMFNMGTTIEGLDIQRESLAVQRQGNWLGFAGDVTGGALGAAGDIGGAAIRESSSSPVSKE